MALFLTSLCLALACLVLQCRSAQYLPNWDSLDKRPLPQWYDDAKFGIFIHWGVFSVPSFGNEWFWEYWQGFFKFRKYVDFMKNNYRPGFTYQDFAAQFTAEFYDANQWADTIKASGARYVVLTSKHHEGFTNWPSKVSWNWNSMDVGPKRDLVGELANAIRNRTDVHFGLYHSLYEWFNPLFLADKKSNYKTQDFVSRKTMPELYELINAYKPEVVWSDGSDGPDTYWNATEFIAWLYNESPVKDTVVVNDRWGNNGISCKHGDFWTCHDRYNPGKLLNHKWENCMTIDCCSWGYRRDAKLSDYLTIDKLVTTLIETVSYGGNLLMNVGPTHDGRIMPLFEERLQEMGAWLKVNGDAIYSTKPWSHQNDTVTSNVWYTSKKSNGATDVYALFTVWPKAGALTLGAPRTSMDTQVTMLGLEGSFNWKPISGGGMNVMIPTIPFNKIPSSVAWVLKITNLTN